MSNIVHESEDSLLQLRVDSEDNDIPMNSPSSLLSSAPTSTSSLSSNEAHFFPKESNTFSNYDRAVEAVICNNLKDLAEIVFWNPDLKYSVDIIDLCFIHERVECLIILINSFMLNREIYLNDILFKACKEKKAGIFESIVRQFKYPFDFFVYEDILSNTQIKMDLNTLRSNIVIDTQDSMNKISAL